MNFAQQRTQWKFYISHALRDLRRNGARTIFALFCIATGVAAVVALRSLALMIADELTLNLAELNRGDIQIVANDDISPRYFTQSNQNETVFSEAGVMALRAWAAEQEVDIQFAANINLLQILPQDENGNFTSPVPIVAILIEPDKWPYYGVVTTSEPSVMTLDEVFVPNQRNLVISKRAALDNNLQIGDQVRVGGLDEPLTIAAFVDDETEGSLVLRNGPAGLIGFIYYPLDRAAEIGLTPLPQQAFVKIPLGRAVEEVDKSLQRRFGRGISRITTAELEEQNQQTADLVNDLILVMGLSSILIGGMGIINTMNVIVGRRTLEIAVLKTLGLKAWRVTLLFLVEAALMGLIGSLIGVLVGIVLSALIRGVGEEVLNTTLSWRAYPEAWFSGITLGLVVTICFGFLPTLNAGQVRPAGVLRPNDIQLPNAGLKRTLGALITTIVVFGLTLNTIVQGQLELPLALMLGLGGFIVGLFGGIMLANEGIMEPIPPQPDASIARRGIGIMTGAISALLLVGLGAVNLFFMDISPLIIYGAPVLLGGTVFFGLRQLTRRSPALAISAARLARQLLLLGGAVILGGLIGGGIFALVRAVLAVLYPDDLPQTELIIGIIASVLIGLAAMLGFRLRGRAAAGTVGLGLMGSAVLSIVGFGIGDLLAAVFGGMSFWRQVENASTGIIVVEIITLALGGAFLVMMGLVWLLARLPSFGSVDAKLSLRNINARKARTASTMIGLVTGIGALSLITLTTSGVTSLLEESIRTDIGGNVVILSRDAPTAEAVRKRLDNTIEGVNSYYQFSIYRGRILLVNGEEPKTRRDMEFGDEADGNRLEFGRSETEEGIGFAFTTIDPRLDTPQYQMKAGRFFTAEDVGKPIMVLREPFRGSFLDELGIKKGSTITWRLFPPPESGEDPVEITFTVIGIIDRDSEQAGAADTFQAPVGSVPEFIHSESIITVAEIQEAYVDAAMVEFAQITNAFALEIGFIVQLAQRLLDQLIAIPALVAVLALVAGIAIIANTVALDTQERRRQIGIMKAVGLKGRRVLAQLMFENAFIGLVSGLIGVGIGLVATLLVGVLGNADQVGETLELMPALRLIVIAVVIAMAATLTSAWTAASESPMNVLRYE